jgi:hypothetical protein
MARWVWVVAAIATSGCVKRYEMRPDAYSNEALGYEVATAGERGVFVSSEWRLENYVDGESIKTGAAYESRIAVDVEDDGTVDTNFTMPLYDLRLVHRRTGAVVWLRTIPLSLNDSERALDGLVRDYIDATSGAGVTGVQFMQGGAVSVSRRFATETHDNYALRVDGREAFGATFDLANVDQVQLEADRRLDRVRIVLVRTGRGYLPSPTRRGLVPFPAILFFGCSSRPEDFGIASSALRALVFATNFVSQEEAAPEPTEVVTEWPWDRPPPPPTAPPVPMTPTPVTPPADGPVEIPVESADPAPAVL